MMYFEHDKKWQTVWGMTMIINPLTAMITINAAIICCDVYVNVVDVVLVLMVFVLFAGVDKYLILVKVINCTLNKGQTKRLSGRVS